MAKLNVTDLDRCKHGRHVNDSCISCGHEFGKDNAGNPHLDDAIGYYLDGAPFTVRDLLRDVEGRTGARDWG